MNEQEIEKYIKNLPKSVQKVLEDSSWEERVTEIANKYSLTDNQTDTLVNNVVLVIIGIEKPDTFLNIITGDLTISRLLAEQILEDLNTRVFEYVLKIVEEKPRHEPITQTSRIPEIKPDNLPMVEVGESAKPYTPEPKPIAPVPKPAEPTQKPYGVPRFGMSQVPPKVQVINMSQNKPATPQSMMDDKMNMITTNIPADMQKKENPNQSMPTTKYSSSDPYREPLN